MTLDKEEHRQLLLELIDNTAFPGKARKLVVELADAIETAKISDLRAVPGARPAADDMRPRTRQRKPQG